MDRLRLGFESFTDQPKVANGASDLMVEIFGDAGRHARSAVGVNVLPLGVAVEVDGIFEIETPSTCFRALANPHRPALLRRRGAASEMRERFMGWEPTANICLAYQAKRPPVNASALPDLAMPPGDQDSRIGLPCRRSLCAFGGMFARRGHGGSLRDLDLR